MVSTDGPSVLYLIDSLAAGGAERSLVEIAPRLVANGINLSVAVLINRGGLEANLATAGIAVQRISGSTRREWYVGATRLLRSQRPDLLHTTLFEADIAGRLAAAVTRTPVVCTLATTPYVKAHGQEAGVRRSRLRAAQLTDAATARWVRRFHAVSESVAEACVLSLKLDRTKIDVIPRGRDRTRLGYPGADRRMRVRSALGIPTSTPVLLCVGRQEPAKGMGTLLVALAELVKGIPEAVLLIAGPKGRSTAEIAGLVESLGLAKVVRMLGEREDIGDLMCAADLLVLPSFREGLPGVVIEAMAMHVPVVASNLRAVREAVPSEEYAYLVTPGDPAALSEAIASAIARPDDARGRADRAAIRFRERFDLDTVADAMVEFYRRAMNA